jgi:Fe-S cluster assembly iron-binding protein IscA
VSEATPKAILDECRRLFHTGGQGAGLIGRLMGPGPRDWDRDCGEDAVRAELVPHYRLLLDHGRVVWACVVQADDALFAPGQADLPANTVYGEDPAFDADIDALRRVANQVFALKQALVDDPNVAKLAALVSDEHNRALNVPLPAALTGGPAVCFTTTLVHRLRLPTGFLADGILPVVVCPEHTPWNMLLPARYWPAALCDLWLATAHSKAPPDAQAIVPSAAGPVPPVTPEAYHADPVRLTERAALEVVEMMPGQGALPGGAYLRVAVRQEGRTLRCVLDPRQDVPDPQNDYLTESHGIRVAVDCHSAAYLIGTEIDFKVSDTGKGFVFNRPAATPLRASA